MERPRRRNHQNCEGKRCSASQTDEATYVTKHVVDGCKCPFLQAANDPLVRELNAGGIPKILIEEAHGLKLSVVSGSKNTPYIAISHVCKDSQST